MAYSSRGCARKLTRTTRGNVTISPNATTCSAHRHPRLANAAEKPLSRDTSVYGCMPTRARDAKQ
jgi:hypothetical protein